MKRTLVCIAGAALLCGCANHNDKAEVKAIHRRPWVGGAFETAPAPKIAREQGFKRTGAVITKVGAETPLGLAGAMEADLILAVGGRKVASKQSLAKALEAAGKEPFALTIYRDGDIRELQVTPGVEQFQKLNNIALGFGAKSSFNVDVWPNPDFSLVALGLENNAERVDLSDAKFKYINSVREREGAGESSWIGVPTEEGWKTWLGPLSLSQRKVIVSQKAAAK